MRIWSHLVALGLASAMGAAAAVACGNGAVGVQACRDIEAARCEAAQFCPQSLGEAEGTDLSSPVPIGDPVAACVRYYNDACLHGLETSASPSNVAVNQCVSAIQAAGKAASKGDAGACTTVVAPQNASPCAFLVPIDAGTPAVVDAGATSDAAGE